MTQRVQVTCDFPECREAVAVPDNPIVGGQELSRFGWGSVAVTQAATKRFDLCPVHCFKADHVLDTLKREHNHLRQLEEARHE